LPKGSLFTAEIKEVKMRDINQISFEEFLDTMAYLDRYANECIEEFIAFLFFICAECQLAGEMFVYLKDLKSSNLDDHFKLVMEHHMVIVAIWLLLNVPDKQKDTIH
jgi:hypothetical protein